MFIDIERKCIVKSTILTLANLLIQNERNFAFSSLEVSLGVQRSNNDNNSISYQLANALLFRVSYSLSCSYLLLAILFKRRETISQWQICGESIPRRHRHHLIFSKFVGRISFVRFRTKHTTYFHLIERYFPL